MYILIDYDTTKDKGIIRSESLDTIRNHFSIKDDKANLKKKIFKSRFVPDRIYAITASGRFDIGLLPDIIKFLKGLNVPFKLILSEEFKERYKTRYEFNDDKIYPLNYELRDYQEEGVKRGLHYGSGIYLFPTGSGKTLLMASLIENITKRIANGKVLLVTLTHLIDQIYDEFVSYGINPSDISKWSGTDDLNTNTKIVICGSHILYNKLDNLPLEIKKAKVVYLTLCKQLKEDTGLKPEQLQKLKQAIFDVDRQIKNLQKRVEPTQLVHEYLKSLSLLLVDECLKAGTLIKTIDGDKPIEQLKTDDIILSYNITNNIDEYKKVTQVHKNLPTSQSYTTFKKITLENGFIIEVTPNHKIFTTNRGYVRADELTYSDDLKI